MLQLNVDFSLLTKYFGITTSKIPQYANKDLEEIMKLEAEQGNEKAANYEQILSDPDKILEIFKLSNVENKYMILQNMSEQDLDKLLPYLKNEQLMLGLQFFEDEKLLSMCEELPTEQLLNVVMQKFSTVDILSLMEEDSMDKFLLEPKVDRKYAQKYFESLDETALEKIMMEVYGTEQMGKTKEEYIDKISSLDDQGYKDFMLSMGRENKINLIDGIVQQDEDLMLLFENQDLVAPMELLMKEDKIKMMGELDAEFLIPMIQELPMDLTQIVLTQIDPRDFSEILTSEFDDILKEVVLFSNKSN